MGPDIITDHHGSGGSTSGIRCLRSKGRNGNRNLPISGVGTDRMRRRHLKPKEKRTAVKDKNRSGYKTHPI